jgi:hypothetical protein
MMAHHGYIFKNKGEISDVANFEKIVETSKRKPLFYENAPWKNPEMTNASQSGFMSLWDWKKRKAVGCEIQYSKKSAKIWKEREDPIYKFRGAIDALMRWAYQSTPKEVFDMLTREIAEKDLLSLSHPKTWETLDLKIYNDLLLYLIRKNILIPYFWKSWKTHILLFTTWTYEDEFKKRWNMERLEQEKDKNHSARYEDMIHVIFSLSQTH